MSEIDPSIAHVGGDRPTASTASALLSAADIWSTAPSPAKTPDQAAIGRASPPPAELEIVKPAGAELKPATQSSNGVSIRCARLSGWAMTCRPLLRLRGGRP